MFRHTSIASTVVLQMCRGQIAEVRSVGGGAFAYAIENGHNSQVQRIGIELSRDTSFLREQWCLELHDHIVCAGGAARARGGTFLLPSHRLANAGIARSRPNDRGENPLPWHLCLCYFDTSLTYGRNFPLPRRCRSRKPPAQPRTRHVQQHTRVVDFAHRV